MSEELPTIGRYEVITRLAVGGMAELFLARELGIAGLERLVVLKRILPHLADKPRFIDMFLREARIVARLAHPNVVQIFDLGEDDGNFFIAMEYIHGSTVRELQVLSEESEGRLPIDVAVAIIVQSLRGLHAAHELQDLDGRTLGLVHRDISPHNLMCTTDGNVKLLDFGVAKATEDGLESTHSGHLKGKFAYMSPEQAGRKELDRRSDVFSMGVVAWEMLAGERLFKREAEVDMMKAVLTEEVPRPSEYDPSIPRAIEDVVLRALERDRDLRWATADAMRQAMVTAATTERIDAGTDPVGKFVEATAGPHLAKRRETLQKALEHNITAHERDGLLQLTGSESHSVEDGDIDLGRAYKLTRDAIRDAHDRSAARDASGSNAGVPAGISNETVVDKHREIAGPTVDLPTESRSRLSTVAVALAALAVAGLSLLVVLSREPAVDAEEPVLLGERIAIAWAPTVDPDILRGEIDPLRRYLERALGRPVDITITKSYVDSSDKLLRGDVAFALLPPLMYLRTRAKDDRVEPLAVKLFDGAAHSDGLILSLGNSSNLTIADLNGKKFCFTDRNSTTGNFLPRAFIKQSGFDPATFIGEVHWSGDHIQALRDLLAGKCEAAAVYSGAFIAADRMDIPIGQLRQIAITGNVPQDPLVAGPTVGRADRASMRAALLAFDPMKELGIPRLGDTQRITAFQNGTDAHFDFLREIVADFEEPAD